MNEFEGLTNYNNEGKIIKNYNEYNKDDIKNMLVDVEASFKKRLQFIRDRNSFGSSTAYSIRDKLADEIEERYKINEGEKKYEIVMEKVNKLIEVIDEIQENNEIYNINMNELLEYSNVNIHLQALIILQIVTLRRPFTTIIYNGKVYSEGGNIMYAQVLRLREFKNNIYETIRDLMKKGYENKKIIALFATIGIAVIISGSIIIAVPKNNK